MSNESMKKAIEYIRSMVPTDALTFQIIEELGEVITAACKIPRADGNGNPTPVTPGEARENLAEECGDVLNACEVKGLDIPQSHEVAEDDAWLEVLILGCASAITYLLLHKMDGSDTSFASAMIAMSMECARLMELDVSLNPDKVQRWANRIRAADTDKKETTGG